MYKNIEHQLETHFKNETIDAPDFDAMWKRIETRTSRRPKTKNVLKRYSAVGILLASLGIATPVIASTGMAKAVVAKMHHAYVVYNGYYYVANGNSIGQSQIGKQLSSVNRIGDWAIKRDGDSNYFGGGIFAVLNQNPDTEIAVKVSTGTKLNPSFGFVILQRSAAVQQPDPKTITGAKNDPQEVQIALDNSREQTQLLYEFQGLENRLTLTLFDRSQDQGMKLYYRIPEADSTDPHGMNIQGFLFVSEYPKELASKVSISAFNVKSTPAPNPVSSFDQNGIHWNYYSDRLLRGEKDGMYYEITTQGNFSHDLLTELVKNFKVS